MSSNPTSKRRLSDANLRYHADADCAGYDVASMAQELLQWRSEAASENPLSTRVHVAVHDNVSSWEYPHLVICFKSIPDLNAAARYLSSPPVETTDVDKRLSDEYTLGWHDGFSSALPGAQRAAAQQDLAYYHGAQQASAIAHQSLVAMDKWIAEGCGNRLQQASAILRSPEEPFCKQPIDCKHEHASIKCPDCGIDLIGTLTSCQHLRRVGEATPEGTVIREKCQDCGLPVKASGDRSQFQCSVRMQEASGRVFRCTSYDGHPGGCQEWSLEPADTSTPENGTGDDNA